MHKVLRLYPPKTAVTPSISRYSTQAPQPPHSICSAAQEPAKRLVFGILMTAATPCSSSARPTLYTPSSRLQNRHPLHPKRNSHSGTHSRQPQQALQTPGWSTRSPSVTGSSVHRSSVALRKTKFSSTTRPCGAVVLMNTVTTSPSVLYISRI